MHHAGADAPAASLMGEAVAVLARIVAVERRKLAIKPALPERLGTGQLVALRPFDLHAAYRLLHGLRRRNALAVAVLDALHAAVAYLAGVDRVWLQLRVGQHYGESLARTELRRQERAGVAELAQARKKRGHAEIDRDVRRGEPRPYRAAPTLAEGAGERVHRLAAADVRHRDRLVAVVFHETVHLPQHHGPVDGVERGIAHGGEVQEVRAFLHAAQAAARNAKAEHDHGFGAREDVARIVLAIRALPAAHRRDADEIRSTFPGLGLDLGRR